MKVETILKALDSLTKDELLQVESKALDLWLDKL